MTIEPHVLQKVGVYEEPNSAYAVSSAATLSNYLDFPYKEGSLQFDGEQALIDPMAGRLAMDAMTVHVLGPRSCTVQMSTALHSHGVLMTGSTAVPTVSTWPLLRVLKTILGGSFSRTAGGTVQVAAGTTVNAVTVSSGRGVDFQKSGVIACSVVSGSSNLELREIKSIAGDVITVKQAFSAVPPTGSTVYGGVTVHMTSDPDTSLQVICQGRELSDRFVFCGLQGGMTLSLPFGQATQLAELSFSLSGPYWERLVDGGSVPTAASYTQYRPIRNVDAELTVPTVGTQTRRLVHQGEITIELPGLAYEDIASGAGVEGVRRKRRLPGRPLVRGSFTTPFEDSTWFDFFANRTNLAVFQQVGRLPGEACLISVPTVQLSQPKRVAQGSIAGQQVSFIGRNDEDVDTPTTDAHTSAFRMHFV